VTDIDPGLIRQWQASHRLAERIAARLAAELRGGRRWDPVDGNFRLAVRMDVSEGTARRAKALLADSGAIMKDATGGTTGYYVT
jgi:DNA-binding GntR family transcriptional regulator